MILVSLLGFGGKNLLKGWFPPAQLHINDIAQRSYAEPLKYLSILIRLEKTPRADPSSPPRAAISK